MTDSSPPSPKKSQSLERFSLISFVKRIYSVANTGERIGASQLFPFRIPLLTALSLPNSKDLGASLPVQHSLPGASTPRTIFLFSLLREPLLGEFLVLILVPLPTEVQVLGLRGKQTESFIIHL